MGLLLGWNRERAHDNQEHEQVVDRQALLNDVAGEVLGADVPARDDPEHDAEQQRRGHVDHRPEDRLAKAHGMRPAARVEQIE